MSHLERVRDERTYGAKEIPRGPKRVIVTRWSGGVVLLKTSG